MRTHEVFAAAAMAVFLLCAGAALAGTPGGKGGRDQDSAEPGAMPKARARIMGYGNDDDPRAAAEKRRNLGGNNDVDEDVKAKKQEQRKKKAERGGR